MTAIEWETGGGVIQHVETAVITPFGLPTGAEMIQRNTQPM